MCVRSRLPWALESRRFHANDYGRDPMNRILCFFFFCASSALWGCGGGDGGKLSSTLVGDYEISVWTENLEGCEAEGASLLESNTNKLALVQVCGFSFFGVSEYFLEVYPCMNAADCDENRCTDDHVVIGGHMFDSGNDEEGWVDDATRAMAGDDGMCTGTHQRKTLTAQSDGTLKVEIRSYEVAPFAETRDCDDSFGDDTCFSSCEDADSAKAAEGQACVSYEVMILSLQTP